MILRGAMLVAVVALVVGAAVLERRTCRRRELVMQLDAIVDAYAALAAEIGRVILPAVVESFRGLTDAFVAFGASVTEATGAIRALADALDEAEA